MSQTWRKEVKKQSLAYKTISQTDRHTNTFKRLMKKFKNQLCVQEPAVCLGKSKGRQQFHMDVFPK